MRRFFVLAAPALALLLAGPAQAQTQREITGRVVQAGTTAPIPDATVGILGAPAGVRTNAEGVYRIRVPEGDATLLVRAIGFKRATQRVPASSATADFQLEKDVLQLEQVVVTGANTTIEKRNATTAISVVSSQDLTRAPASSIEGQLQGKVLGTSINMNTGQPGGGGQIQIRGVTSIIGQGDPLFVVDGVIISNTSQSSGANSITGAGGGIGGTQDGVVNRLADINPNEIESIEVLKSAAATAIYGSRATNGVVVIRTKRGSAGRNRINFLQRVGTQEPMKLVGQRRYTSLEQALDYADAKGESEALVRQLWANGTPAYNNFQEQLYSNTDPSYETVLSSSGGSDQTQYYASLTQKVEQGTMLNTDARLQAGRINLDNAFSTRLRGSFGLNFTRNYLRRGISNNDNTGLSPIYNFGYMPSFFDLRQKDAQGNFVVNPWNGGGALTSNPFQVAEHLKIDEDVYRTIGSGNITYTAFTSTKNNVNIVGAVGVDRFQQQGEIFSPAFLQYELNDGLPGTATLSEVQGTNINSSLSAVWTYNPGMTWFNSVNASVGTAFEQQGQDVARFRARGLNPGVPNVNQGQQNSEQTKVLFRDQAVYANADTRWFNEKLTVSGGVRADRSSANGDVEKWYLFPRASASYNLGDMIPSMDQLKLRVAYGQTGNRPRYGDRDILLASGGVYEGSATLVAAGVLGNPVIRPETLNEFEAGVDFSFLRERLSFEVTYYDRTLEDQLLQPAVAPTSGNTGLIVNAGKLINKGWEAGVTAIPIDRGGFNWTTRVGYQSNEQDVSDLPSYVPPFPVAGSFGDAYGRNYIRPGYGTTLIWGNVPVIDRNPDGTGKTYHPVGYYIDTPSPSVSAVSIVGDANPDFLMQFVNDFRWNRLSLNFLFDWRSGGDVANMTRSLYDEGYQSRDFDAPSPRPDMTLGEYNNAAFNGGTDARIYVEDGSYVKLRELSLSYDVPTNWYRGLSSRITNMQLQLQGRNLAMWSDYWGADPEVNNFGNTNLNRFIDLAPYPTARSFWFSINLGF